MKVVLIIFLSTVIIQNVKSGQWSYCHPNSCRGSNHTLCIYKVDKTGLNCNKVFSNSITPKERREIVRTHNQLRQRVARGLEKRGNPGPQPGGCIGKLRWDKTLARIAQAWANQCIFNHDPCRDVRRFMVGQNVLYRGFDKKYFNKLSDLITEWFDEVADFPNYLVENFQPVDGPVISHYTNIVWSKTTRIGCGLVRHYTFDHMYRTHLVCNYGERGNWYGEPVYETL